MRALQSFIPLALSWWIIGAADLPAADDGSKTDRQDLGALAKRQQAALWEGFQHPPKEARTRLYWRIFGPAWTPPEIDYQLQLIKDAGVGGVTAYFTYPFAEESEDVHNQKYLSPEFLQTFRYSANKAHSLDLRFGVAGGTGWPFGGPNVQPTDAAKKVWLEKPTAPGLPSGAQVIATYSGTNFLGKGSTKPSAQKSTELSVALTGLAGMQVKRAALGAEGLVVDHYDAEATTRYLDSQVLPLLKAAPGLVEWIFCDSLEVYRANWTRDFPRIFARSRGYDLEPHLPALFDRNQPSSEDVHFDFWRTLAETTETRFTETLYEWSHAHGTKLEMEAYGTPPNPLTAARYIDLPTGEQYEWKGFSLSRLAASGAHLTGRRVIGAEAWTWMGLPNRLGDSLSDTKLCSDLHYLAGVNDLTGVDFAYSPRSAGSPGWQPYYGPVFNQNNPQWPWFKELVTYTSRCQWLLRQGKPVADVAVYLPVEDIFAAGSTEQMLLGFELRDHFASGPKTDEFGLQTALRHRSDLLTGLFINGLNYDGIDFFSVNRLAWVRNGHLHIGDGDYTTVILPNLKGLDLDSLIKLEEFRASGGNLIVTRHLPDRVYGLKRAQMKITAQRFYRALLGEKPDSGKNWTRLDGVGRVSFVMDEDVSLYRALAELNPDVLLDPPQAEVGFVHRRSDALDIYFLANTGHREATFKVSLRCRVTEGEQWDPLSGDRHGLKLAFPGNGRCATEVKLPPRGSTFLVLGAGGTPKPGDALPWQSETLPINWELTFDGIGSHTPPAQALTNLVSWTDDPASRYFSGQGEYRGGFLWNHATPAPARLILSEVHEAAEVSLNGHPIGSLWTPPYELDLLPHLKTGSNWLTIKVGNLPLNEFLGLPDRDLTRLRALYGNRFPAPEEKSQRLPPAASGLIGPVSIRFPASELGPGENHKRMDSPNPAH